MRFRILAPVAALATVWATSLTADAATTLQQVSSDPYANSTSQHATEVEPDTFSFGSTIVETAQVGRFFDGGATNAGWATSTDNGTTWTHGSLPGVTKYAGGAYDRTSDEVVAYDARHNVWLISSLAILETPSVHGAAVLTSRSTDGGLTWSNPVTTATGSGLDKNWIVCDNTSTSPFYGHCYTEWDDNANGNRLRMSTSSDGGLIWGAALSTANSATGIGGQPVVQPGGTVIVPAGNANDSAIIAFSSTDGGASWSSPTTVTTITDHAVAGGLRTEPLPSAEIDATGKVYVTWQDCRFRSRCKSNDIVMSTTTNGTTWSSVVRIPIDSTTSAVDHFIPGLAVDKATSGSTAHLALTYYYYPAASCSSSTCQLDVGYVSSTNGGSSWTLPMQLAGPMTMAQIASTSQGPMVGDYISTSFAGGTAHAVFAVGKTKSGSTFDEALWTTASGLSAPVGAAVVTSHGERPVPGAASDHVAARAPVIRY
ncbi:MAG: sialidase family protein [Frankiaceae bacterium]